MILKMAVKLFNRIRLNRWSALIIVCVGAIVAYCIYFLMGVVLVTPIPDFQYSTSQTVDHGPHYETAYDSGESEYSSLYASVIGRSKSKNRKISTVPGSSPVTIPSTLSQSSSSDALPFGIAAADVLPWKTQQDLDLYFLSLKDLGVSWVRIDVGWDDVQPKNVTMYDWSGLDRVVETAKRNNINILGTLAYTPKWAHDVECMGGPKCAPSDFQLFANFSETAATRYKSTIRNWEVWNEQNIQGFWSPQPNAVQYVKLLKVVYTAIKKANPQAMVISGGLSPAENVTNSSIAPATFIQAIYANGAKNFFDAVAFHPYTYPASLDYVADWNPWQQIQQLRNILVAQGDGAKKIWLTEYGAPTGGPGMVHDANQLKFTYGYDYMSEATQSKFVTSALNSYAQNKDWLGPLFWYSLKDLSANTNDPENFFGLLRADGSKKPAYDVFKNAISAQ